MRSNILGQIKTFESIAVLLIFFFLVAVGINFYGNLKEIELEENKDALLSLKTVQLANIVVTMPELSCSLNGVTTSSCIDIVKLEVWSDNDLDNRYFDIFGTASIRIVQLFPNEQEWLIYNRTEEDATALVPTRIPVNLFDPREGTSGTKSMAYVEINTTR